MKSLLTNEDIIRIDSIAKEVLLSSKTDDGGDPMLPIDLSRILKMYSINTMGGKFKDESVSGVYDRKRNSIYISRFEPYSRKTFTVAHELGHFLLHENKQNEIFHRSKIAQLDNESEKIEAEANWFAASLLMPEESIKKYWTVTHNMDKLATIFGTSPTAVFYRLKNLSLIT